MTDEHTHRIHAVRREGERVTNLELFFDLVFVLAITQCTALMADHPDWGGLLRGVVLLGVLWWAWVGYAWLTSVVDPEEGAVRLVMFAAMAALLIVALCVPDAFGDLGTAFVLAYAAVRAAHIALFVLASHDEPQFRRSVISLAASTALANCVLGAGAFLDGDERAAVWALALALDMLGPFLFRAAGWQLMPGHFAERHGLIVIIALGESIVAIGIGGSGGVDGGVVAAAVAGIALAAGLWWLYFDVVALLAARRLADATAGREQNEMARDAYSLIHFPMVAGIVLVALGLKTTLAHVGDPLDLVPAAALCGGAALYLVSNVAFKLRAARSFTAHRVAGAVGLLALIPIATSVDAVVAVALTAGLVWVVVVYELTRFGDPRNEIRHAS